MYNTNRSWISLLNKRLMQCTLLAASLFWSLPLLAFNPGDRAPDFSLKSMDGTSVVLSELRGQPLILEIGTTWCPGCRIQSKEVDTAVMQFGGEISHFKIFVQETQSSVQKYLEDIGVSPDKALLDDSSVQKDYAVFLIPRILVIDPTGHVLHDGVQLNSAQIIEQLAALTTDSGNQKDMDN